MLKRTLGFNFFDVFVVGFCVIFGLICFYPLWYVFLGSLEPTGISAQQPLKLFFTALPNFNYYKLIMFSGIFQKAFAVSVIKTILGTAGGIIVTSMLAYGVSKAHIPGMRIINFLVVFTMFFSGGLIPSYFLMRDLHMLDTFWALIVPSMTSVFNFIIMRNYFLYSVPAELEDAAVIDGANQMILFFKIVIPISKPMLAAVSLFLAVGHWNDWYTYLIYCLRRPDLKPYMMLLQNMLVRPEMLQDMTYSGNFSNVFMLPSSLRMTVIMVGMLPIILVYPLLQKHFAKGVLIGAVKG